ncbi:hypothetical protein M9Y10_015856 [Tritrichomonas musculus]|uniref:Uncharacterized protein n=1 Tax=Tritrichomonas musculus TaxID=1915356 RepID=A0ABR2I517_9EUKA
MNEIQQMAFGSWFKKISSKIVNGVKKALPVVRKIIDIGRQVAPIIAPIIGGGAGKLISNVGKIAGEADRWWNAIANKPVVNADRFAAPMLK